MSDVDAAREALLEARTYASGDHMTLLLRRFEAEARAAALDEARGAVEAVAITAPSDLSRESLDLRDGFDWHKHEALAAIDALREDR